jgi:hypothetical protein
MVPVFDLMNFNLDGNTLSGVDMWEYFDGNPGTVY